MFKLLVLSAFSVIGICVGQILQDGQCHQNTVVENFNLDLINGTWYEVRITDHQTSGDCSRIEFSTGGNETTVAYKTVRQNFYQEYAGEVSNVANTSLLTLNISSLSNSPINIWVLSIDYEIFALLYGCQNVGTTQRLVHIWQLSRTTSFPTVWVDINLENLMTQHFNISNSDLREVSHSDEACYELPAIEAGQPVVLQGQCQSLSGVANFDGGRFLGVWQQIRSYYSPNSFGNCNRAQYIDGGDRVNVINSEIINQTLLTQEGYATVSNVTSGLLNVVFELPNGTVESELVVLGTNYNQWAVTYSCININNETKQVFSWVLSRSRVLPASAAAEVNAVISSFVDLNDAFYVTTDQSDASCFYSPTAVAGQSVVFGGQCDGNISVMSNFTAENFLNQWYEIERYPSQFQTGQCNNAFYSPGQGPSEIGVLNTQVINESLSSIPGVGVVVDNGKFQIAFPSTNNLTSDYWVIATDYTSYALMYSCNNINDYQQQINFWKLSRTKQLTIQAQGAIFAIIGSIPVLQQNFFEVTDQSAAACFYYPDPQPGRPVVFPGSCDANVPVVPNFNTSQFDGQWFVVESYPIEPSEGSCISHQFSTGTGSAAMNLVTTNVFDQLLRTVNGQLTLYSNETGGRFTLSTGSGAQNVSYPYYVVATDYNDYALIYSCLDIPGTDFRNIWAWKLSRTKQLSTTGITQINNAMASFQVLSNNYFEPVDQSDDACFFFPDLAAGEPVILPGQCDISLPVVQNFNAERYLGRWRLIESYPADNQIGQCNQANYTAGNSGTILVYNNEVVNQTLREINGIATTAPQIGNQTEGKLIVTFPNSNQSTELWILDTDYVSYSFVYGCQNVNNQQRRVWSWKLSRNTSLADQANNAITAVINSITVLNQRYYQTVNQSDDACFYYPAPGASPTIFRGQCDLSIPTVSNFNATAYLGLWHDIGSYTFPFQNGNCPNAYYTLNEQLGLVEVFNTQVLNETLDTISGTARVISDGKLEVNFPSMGSIVTPYWVLATDYVSYALVYSCVNINAEQRSVVSWKLSRTKSLGATAVTAINAVVNSIPVLDEQYYVTRDQTPQGCFYYPEPQPGVPVVFPGQCDGNIPVVNNFTLNQFGGDWYEIETYPKEFQPGECINHQFSAGADLNSLNLLSTNVVNQLLGTTVGNVTLYPNQTDGRLSLTGAYSNGTTFSFPYYIIATDYENYALVYSCLNLNTDYRAVYAWKLSRTKQLSNNSSAAINTAMASIDVLRGDYFEPVDQSDDACFYFPDLAPGEPVILPGQCGNLPVVQNFDAERYLGRWRLIESYPADNQIGQCNQANYTVGNSGTILVYNNEVVNQTLREINGIATTAPQIGNQTEGKLIVTFPNSNQSTELWILDTDYISYSFVYGCQNVNNQQRRVWSWKLSRNTSLTDQANNAITAVINNTTVLNQRYYQTVNQSDGACFYYPAPGASPTIFRGQCDLSIPTVSNFNATAYLGLWHDIASYTFPFQNGNCPNAYYTLNEQLGLVEVFNTQVLNETLDTISGTARVISDGKLEVNFPSMGSIVTPYWVLATDYVSYALVYSCVNINAEQRSVVSWKLSRTKSLGATAVTAINAVVNSIPVLDEQYYVTRDQTPQGCFYYPEPQPGVPVVFPGQCDGNIPVVNNFTLNQFGGDWYEIETYPKEFQPGECINHQFSAGADLNSLNLLSTNVVNQLLGTTVGNVTLYPNQTDGRLSLTGAYSNGTTFSFPYYIIATDYENYALVYSCLNLNTDYRAVYAWKLSRTKQLSNNSSAAINTAMASIDVLRGDYFEPVDQSDDACFYFPDLAPGEPVILPGQCDSLPVVQNFDAERYLGRWRLIESYPADNQIGQCNQANYSAGISGTILVYNNEVVNQTLREINGIATTAPQIGNQTEGKLIVTFPNSNQSTELWILDTDYVSYSFVYGCQNVNNQQRRVWSWKLSRNTSLTDQVNNAITAVINNITVLNQRYYQTVNQSDDACFYYPAPGASPTIFRGQCDLSIPTVSNFNATAYLGLWHDIASYTFPFQNGNCPNAYYTLNEQLGLVEVFNTQVLNETLDTISGTARVISDGKLEVNFPSMGSIVTPYWVLATDYVSYALVYSCVNINAEQRSVVSWKLSRTKSLGATAVTAINSVINSIPVLDEQYYVSRDQTPQGCFYYPEPQPGVPVVFPGQCNANISVVTNFNLTQFSGVWHEIETYPKIQQTGECVNHDFSVFGNALNMQSYSVIAQSLGVTEGLVQFTNGTDARMTITFTSNGTEYQIPYWIIATDYVNYALAYSCVDLNEDYRGIWSWKLSRSKQLRPVDVTSINNAIANIDVLGNQYYENIDQSPEACFFYPETAPGEEVVFPGQCGNVQAMPNFNATAYLGLWRMIEAYPSRNQQGTCNEANYSLQGGVVQVFNTQVVNETLSTISGTAQAAADGSGRLIVTFPNSPEPVELLVLDTDYETYAIVYACINNITSDQRTVFSWKLSRTNLLSQAAVLAINSTVARIDVLDERYYATINRTAAACFYFPEPSNSTVIFRGQCNENVPVQANFSAAAYAGTWYSIEAYPAPFEGGTCGTASYEYHQESGSLYVQNSQIRDQVLNVQSGIAEVLDNAKLKITFENNVTSDYWILATDYNSYSLAYSCENINTEYKRVFSWKFSKTKSLTAAGIAAINNVINAVQVLEQQYFVPEGQSEDDCFYYPNNYGGDVILDGQCPPASNVTVVTNFNVTAFSGVWLEVARFPSDLQQGECAANDFAPGAQNSITITQTLVDGELQSASVIPGAVSPDGRGVISATIAGVPFEALYILDTDYEEYALIYSCRELSNSTKQIYSWKLSRSRSGLSPSANTIIDGIVSSNVDLFYRYYEDTDQTNAACFHYPEFPEGLPENIDLPGPCNETVRGVAGFDAAAYTGLWLEIESYPDAQQQNGTCSRAYYSPGDGNVLVRNTEVIGNSLSEMLGTAEVASNDGSGLLNVYFNISGVQVTANYYILATDYTNYALVYSCRNTDDGRRRVSSWKLSRNNTLSAAAHIAMDSAIAATQGLLQRYYQATSQSDDDCFYIPQVTDSAPLFRGRCANVSGVSNFNANMYAGWWHELERYPVDGNAGQCISSQYTASGNAIQVVDTSVNNGAATIVTGTVTATSDGRLIRALSNGATEELIVLDTDYNNYSLLYSCVDVMFEGQEYRKVWSAKHSKTRVPSSVNVASINATIASNLVLDPGFYQTVDQSNQACFHYPEVQGNRVILPGQCDANIPVVNNFDVGAYEGTWYQIERYPQAYENPDSTCIGARYILNSDTGVVSVLNWEQLNGELLTIEGNATLTSSDGSAKLDVTLPVYGTNDTVMTSLYVLATDYESFSLVYSCRNVNNFQRSIGAWKLSRGRTLPAAGNAAINDVISRREELDARYFLSTEQNENCPEPSSGALIKSSVLVILVCFVLQWF